MINPGCSIFVDGEGYVTFPVYVQPRASKCEYVGIHNQRVKIKVRSAPVDNEANNELRKFLSKIIDIPRADIQILKGLSSRNKLIKVVGLSKKYVEGVFTPECS